MDRPQRLARRQERESVNVYGGRLVPRSGSGDQKGDIETGTELIECKHTEQLSYRLRWADWAKHVASALVANRRPVLEVEYTDPLGGHPRYLVVLDRDDYLELRHRADG